MLAPTGYTDHDHECIFFVYSFLYILLSGHEAEIYLFISDFCRAVNQ